LDISVTDYTEEHLSRLRSILENIGKSVTKLFLNAIGKRVKVYQSALISWLNLMPNLQHISTGGLFSCEEVLDAPENLRLNLKKLQNVQLCPFGLSDRLHDIPESSIKWLQFNDKVPSPNVEKIFLKHCKTLKRLDLFREVYTDPKPFRVLKLETLICLYQEYMNNSAHDEFLSDIIKNQSDLLKLELGEGDLCSNCYPVSAPLLRTICDKAQLTELHFGLSRSLTTVDIFGLRKLAELKELTIQMQFMEYSIENSMDMVEVLCSTGLSSLESLRLIGEFNGPLSLNLFLESFENLRKLELSESFNRITFNNGKIYPKMNSFILYSDELEVIDIHPCLIKSMPNLTELTVRAMFPRVSTFRSIFKSKIHTVDLTMSHFDIVSVYKMKKIKKWSRKIAKNCERRGGECEIKLGDVTEIFSDTSDGSIVSEISFDEVNSGGSEDNTWNVIENF
jgi:hypothetical protein